MEKLRTKIAGEIALSENPGGTMRKWREIFGITQVALSQHLGISTSTMSDYEANRRSSPGIAVVKRFVDGLIGIDQKRGAPVIQKLRDDTGTERFFDVHEFETAISGLDFVKLIDGKPVTGDDLLERAKVYGYTLINSMKVILELPYT